MSKRSSYCTHSKFSWKRFWKNFNLAAEPIIKFGALSVAVLLVLHQINSGKPTEGIESFLPSALTIGAVIWRVKKKPPS